MSFFGFGGGVSFNAAKDIPSLAGKVILVTGGTNGLGRESVKEFARHEPERIYLAARSLERAQTTIEEIRKEVPNAPPIEPIELDLASLASVKAAAAAFASKSQRLDILMLNAGIMMVPHGVTKDGYELQFGTNHVGHAALAKLLLPTLLRTAERPGADVRVVVLTSAGLGMAPRVGVDFDALKTPSTDTRSFTLYGQSKLANALYAQELARKYPQLRVSSIHPGGVSTNLAQPLANSNIFLKALLSLAPYVLTSVQSGARNQLWASVSKDVVNGEYYTPVGKVGTGMGVDLVKDTELAGRLWDWTEKELKEHGI